MCEPVAVLADEVFQRSVQVGTGDALPTKCRVLENEILEETKNAENGLKMV